MSITKLLTRYSIPPTLLFTILIILFNVYGQSMDGQEYEVLKAFLTFPNNNTGIDCETISLGIRSDTQDDSVQMEDHRAVVIFTENEDAMYLDPRAKVDYLARLLLDFLNNPETRFGCNFGTYTYGMRNTPFLQYINFSNDTIYMKYFYHEVQFELTLSIDSEANMELQRVTIDAPIKGDHMYSKITYDISSDQFKNLSISETLDHNAQGALDYVKEQVSMFQTFPKFLEKVGVSNETQELMRNTQLLLK